MTSQKTSSTPSSNVRFEDNLRALEEVVKNLEREDIPLEKLLDEFENGVKLLKICREYLNNARSRIEQYVEEKDGQWILKEYDGK